MRPPKRFLVFFLTLILAGLMVTPAFAAGTNTVVSPRASSYIYAVWASCSSGSGSITVDFDITATGIMTSLGSTTIEIKNSSGTTVKVFKSATTPSMMGSNQLYYSSSVTWYGATSGSKYYAIVYFRASNSSGYDTTSYTTSFCTAK